MDSSLLPEGPWAREEFGTADLGDVRRNQRLVQIAAAIARSPHGTLPQSFGEDQAGCKAAYRFCENPQVQADAVRESHLARTRQACQRCRRCLLIEDSSTLDYSAHGACQKLGRIGDDRGRGLFLHSTLALDLNQGQLLGLFAQRCWARPPRADGSSTGKEPKRQRLLRPRESARWGACLAELGPGVLPGQYTLVADAEADDYELLGRCRRAGVSYVIRACQNRALQDRPEHLKELARTAAVHGEKRLRLRSRPGTPAREAVLAIRAAPVQIHAPWRPGPRGQPLRSFVLHVLEVNAPAGVEPIQWYLLTDWECWTLESCLAVIEAYTWRWLIEEYHKCLKSGCALEKSQLEHADRLQRLIAILAVVAVRLLDLKLLAQQAPDQPVQPRTIAPQVLAILTARVSRPQKGWTHRTLLRAIARLGGFQARRGDGEPGWQTIWRGWQKLSLLAEGYAHAMEDLSCG